MNRGSQKQSGAGQPARACRGFTLIEILLVILILGIITAVTFPILSHSIRGNRIRLATRQVVMAGRYARSMAVLQQKDLTLGFDLGARTLTVAGKDDRAVLLSRKLDEVAIESLELADDHQVLTEGSGLVTYRNNGVCTPYTVRLKDASGRQVSVVVDALSSVETEER